MSGFTDTAVGVGLVRCVQAQDPALVPERQERGLAVLEEQLRTFPLTDPQVGRGVGMGGRGAGTECTRLCWVGDVAMWMLQRRSSLRPSCQTAPPAGGRTGDGGC